MTERIAFETTLSTRSYVSLVKRAKQLGYKVTLLFFWLDSPKTAKGRVAKRVSKGGHNIPEDVIERRYYRGIQNLTHLYIPLVDYWLILNNTKKVTPVAEGMSDALDFNTFIPDIWYTISNGK